MMAESLLFDVGKDNLRVVSARSMDRARGPLAESVFLSSSVVGIPARCSADPNKEPIAPAPRMYHCVGIG